MFIKHLCIHNFKGFCGENSIEFGIPDVQTPGSGLNILVGENNTGKSTLFEAIHFLRNNTKKNIEELKFKSLNSNNNNHSLISVTADFVGEISEIAETYAGKKAKSFASYTTTYKPTLNYQCLRVQRSGENTKDLKEIKLFNSNSASFDNVTGIDAPFRALFDLNVIWADTNPQDEAKFGSSSLCGSLLKAIASDCVNSQEFKDFSKSFNKLFNYDGSLLRQQILNIEDKVNVLFEQQFGGSKIHFSFDLPTSDTFFKNVRIQLSNNERTTDLSEEGMGLQRGVALSLLQVYAEMISQNTEVNVQKPFIFFIDEPEICLHPLGQKKLLKCLLSISKKQQVFISTHSPFFLEGQTLQNATLILCVKENGMNHVTCYPKKAAKLLPWSPSWGEICFAAYNLPTIDFHNELYGHLQYLTQKFKEKEFDTWLGGKLGYTKHWIREGKGNNEGYDVTLQTFIRNKIHHPENTIMATHKYSDEELSVSIKQMMTLIRELDGVR